MTRSLVAGAIALLLLAACVGPDPNVTEGGKGKPELELAFPRSAAPGSIQVAELTITNPGPGDMESVVVAFSRLGDPSLPAPVVDVAGRGREGAVEDVSPEPNAISQDGIIYTFDAIAEGDSTTITFRLRMPVTPGPAGNAVLVYEGRDPERARGVRLEIEIEG